MLNEPEILDASRSFPDAQALMSGVRDPSMARRTATCTWYDTTMDEHVGSFALIQDGSDLEDLVGEVVRVKRGKREIFVYVIGGADIPSEIAIQRNAAVHLMDLAKEEIRVYIEAIQR